MYHRQQNTRYPHRWQILLREFLTLSRFMICYPRLLQIKDLLSIIGCEPIKSFEKLFSQYAFFGVKGILLQWVLVQLLILKYWMHLNHDFSYGLSPYDIESRAQILWIYLSIYLSSYILIKLWSPWLFVWGRAYESWIRNGYSNL